MPVHPKTVFQIRVLREAVVTEWNLQHGEVRGFWLKHQHWTTDSHPDLSERGQGVINRQMVDDSDIIVAIFWSRFGTATGVASSGTEEEIRRGIQLGRKVTYVSTDEGWLYVAGVLDRCTRRCVGWAMADTLATTLPLAALDMALKQRRPPDGLGHHSDRGVQYASAAYRQRLAAAGVIPA